MIEHLYRNIIDSGGDAIMGVDANTSKVLYANRWAVKLTGLHAGDHLFSPPHRVILDFPSLGWLQKIILETRGKKTLHRSVAWETRRHSKKFDMLLDLTAIRIDGSGASVVIVIRNKDDSVSEKTLWQRNRDLHLLNQASRAVSRSLDPIQVARTALDFSLKLFKANAGTAYLVGNRRQGLVKVSSRGMGRLKKASMPIKINDQPQINEIINTGEPAVNSGGFVAGHLPRNPYDCVITIPLRTSKSVLGVIELASNQGCSIVDYDTSLMSSFGFQVGTALDNAILHKQVEKTSHFDGLTGACNRQKIEALLRMMIKRGTRYGGTFAVLMVDLDHFKSINDVYGHSVGDQVLKKVARILLEEIRDTDYLGRWGGEEFLIILPEVDIGAARTTSERIRRHIAAMSFVEESVMELPITVCIGISCYPEHSENLEGLVQGADDAMLLAKRSGRNQTQVYCRTQTTDSTEDVAQHQEWIKDFESINALAAALDAKDAYTGSHSQAVMMLSVELAKEMHVDEERVKILGKAALLHDIGKVAVPDSVLNKPGPLNEKEWAMMKEHPRMGVSILKEAPALSSIIPVVLYHHEHYDGSGYPEGRNGKKIPPLSRILCVADAFMAMTSARPYRKALSAKEAWRIMKKARGDIFDPAAIDALGNLFIKSEADSFFMLPKKQ